MEKDTFTNSLPQGFKYTIDHYKCGHLELQKQFDQQTLQKCIKSAIQANQKALWIHLHSNNLKHVNFLCKQLQFKIHHGKNTDLFLYKWLSPLKDLIPDYSMFVVACGAIVLKNQRVLLTQQKGGPRKGQFGIPGGRADFGQMIHQCAQRQLFQQTGIKANYRYTIFMRQLQKNDFGCVDLYFGCIMSVSDQQLKNIKLCDREIKSCEWIHLKQIGDWMQTRAKGTQLNVARYLQDLYQKGFNFDKQKNDIEQQFIFGKSLRDNVQRRGMIRKLVSTHKQIQNHKL